MPRVMSQLNEASPLVFQKDELKDENGLIAIVGFEKIKHGKNSEEE